MTLQAKRAKRTESRLRIGFVGPSGSGKTYTALRIARALVGPDGKILVIDTERGSASLYADMPECAGEFDVIELDTFAPATFIEAIEYADAQGYQVIIIDSLSHAWMGKDGALEMVDAAAAKSRSGNNFAAWREVTPEHNKMIDSILRARCHVFVTMRAKTEWVIEKDEKGKSVPRKVGMQPVQRDGMEYEFTIVGDMDDANTWSITKDRTSRLAGHVWRKPGADVAKVLNEWLAGAQAPDAAAASPSTPPTNGNGAHGQGELPTEASTQPSNAEREAAKAVGLELQRLAESMGYSASDMGDVVKHVYNARNITLVPHAQIAEMKKDLVLKAALFPQVRDAVFRIHFDREGFEPDKDMAKLIDKTHEVLADKASLDHDSKPLRAPASAWQAWLAELQQKVEAAA